MNCPSETAPRSVVKLKERLPFMLVVTCIALRKVSPSPLPDSSAAWLEKNRMVKSVLGVELSLPAISVVPSRNLVAELMTGKFCRRLAPVSESGADWGVAGLSLSLGVTPVPPSAPSCMPNSALSWMELARMLLPVPELGSDTPCTWIPWRPSLKAMVLLAAPLPPTVLLDPPRMYTPLKLPRLSPLLP